MNGYRELLEKEVMEAWRTRRLVVLAALFVGLGTVVPVLTSFLPAIERALAPPDSELFIDEVGVVDVVDLLVRSLLQFGALVAILVAMGSVAGERERGTARLVLARPVTRGAYLLAKLVALGMVLGLAIALGVLAAWVVTGILFGPVSLIGWAQLALVAWLSAVAYASITLLGSTLAPSPLGAAAIGVAVVVAFTLASAAPVPNPWLPTGLAEVARAAALEEFGPELQPGLTIGITAAIAVGAFVLAWLSFRRQDV